MKHTEKELIDIYTDVKGDALYVKYFIQFYEVCLNEFEIDNDWEEEDENIEEHTLKFCLKFYLPFFIKFLKVGHGAIWSDEIARLIEIVQDSTVRSYIVEDPFIDTYKKIKKENPELAWKEINIHSNSLSTDDIFKKYFLFLVENEDYKDIENRTFNYVKEYREQISLGKSEVYALEYARLIASRNLSKTYCEEFAFAYDNAINENKSIEYATEYAEKYASELVDIKRRYGFSDDKKMIGFAIEKINDYMKAWEYTTNNHSQNS